MVNHAAAAELWIGRVIDGRYRVLGTVEIGGMGMIYRVEHVRMGRIAAMKVAPPLGGRLPW